MPLAVEHQDMTPHRHGARHFAALPGVVRSMGLLDEIVNGAGFEAPLHSEKRLALYGAGDFGHMALDVLLALWMKPAYIIDRNAQAARGDPAWGDIPVISPEEATKDVKANCQILVTVATAPYVPIENALMDLGFQHVLPFYDFSQRYRHIHPLSNGWRAHGLTATDEAMAATVLQGLEDDVSRAHYLQFLAWRRLRQEWVFQAAPVQGADRFFIPQVVQMLRPGDCFVDAGAYHGLVSERFATLCPDWGTITAIEPDAESREILGVNFRRVFADNRQPDILDCALGAHNARAAFHAGLGYASQLATTGRQETVVRPLDELGLTMDVLKLHLEGGELDALKGAQQTLARQRPIIAATIYHNDDGVWRTPLYLMQTLKEYRFLIRLHSWCGTGAVLYALPRERSPE